MIINGDCIEAMAGLSDNTYHALVTDQPYGFGFMGKAWDSFSPRGLTRFTRKWARQAFRVLRPGAFGLVFGGSRTFHRIAVGLEDAGFEIRDVLMWLYVSGFPKGVNLAKSIDKHFGVTPTKGEMKCAPDGGAYIKRKQPGKSMTTEYVYGLNIAKEKNMYEYIAGHPTAALWNDHNYVLKPAWEPIILIKKPHQGTYVENILRWHCGGLNIKECRIPIDLALEKDARAHKPDLNTMRTTGKSDGGNCGFYEKSKIDGGYKQQLYDLKGRYPTNIIIDELVQELMNNTNNSKKSKVIHNSDVQRNPPQGVFDTKSAGYYAAGSNNRGFSNYGDGGGLGRWFYCPKTSTSERNIGLDDAIPEKRDTTRNKPIDNPFNRNNPVKNKHPTIKPIKLMTYLVRLVKPPIANPLILDPFGGTGATHIACKIEGCECTIIEKNPDYVRIITARDDLPLEAFQKYVDAVILDNKNNISLKEWM